MEDKKGAYKVSVGRSDGKSTLGRPRRRWRVMLKWIFKQWNRGVWTGLNWLRIGTRGGRL
jgi:hypothetical protein